MAKRREGRGRGEEEERSEGTHELTVGRTRWLLHGRSACQIRCWVVTVAIGEEINLAKAR